jgi:hypothetical protein
MTLPAQPSPRQPNLMKMITTKLDFSVISLPKWRSRSRIAVYLNFKLRRYRNSNRNRANNKVPHRKEKPIEEARRRSTRAAERSRGALEIRSSQLLTANIASMSHSSREAGITRREAVSSSP